MSKGRCGPTGIAGRVWCGDRFILLERALRRREARGQRALREALKVGEAGIAPPARFFFLNGEKGGRFGISSASTYGPESPRCGAWRARLDAVRVMHDEFIPERSPGGQPVIPAQVMKPQQVFFRCALDR